MLLLLQGGVKMGQQLILGCQSVARLMEPSLKGLAVGLDLCHVSFKLFDACDTSELPMCCCRSIILVPSSC